MKKRIVVTINEVGDIRLETAGYAGYNCTRETESLKSALGLEIERTVTIHNGKTAVIDMIKENVTIND